MAPRTGLLVCERAPIARSGALTLPSDGGVWLPGGACDEGGDDVGGVTVEGDAGSVVAHGGARVGVAGCFLDVAEWHAGVEGGGDEGVAQGVRSDPLGDPGVSG